MRFFPASTIGIACFCISEGSECLRSSSDLKIESDNPSSLNDIFIFISLSDINQMTAEYRLSSSGSMKASRYILYN